MKTVSFKVAKAIKEVGYPQGETNEVYVTKDINEFEEGELVETYCTTWAGGNVIDAPLAIDVWLWLWRERKKWIDVSFSLDEGNWTFMQDPSPCNCGLYNDPEEAIIAAIEYLVNNNLLV